MALVPDVIGEGVVECPCAEYTFDVTMTIDGGGPWPSLQVVCPNCDRILEVLTPLNSGP